MITFKEHFNKRGNVLAACDSNLINKSFIEKDKEVIISDKFYGNKKATKQEFIKLLSKHDNINLVGNKVVEIAIKEGKVKKYSLIQGVKLAIILTI